MTQSLADPCVLYKRNDDGSPQLIVTLTVDDCAIAGKQEHIDWFMDMVAARFKITRGGRLKKHLGVDYVWKKDEKGETTVEATMDAKANNIVDDYEAYIGSVGQWRCVKSFVGEAIQPCRIRAQNNRVYCRHRCCWNTEL